MASTVIVKASTDKLKASTYKSKASSDKVAAGYWYCHIEVPIPVASIPSQYFTHLFAAFADVDPITYKVSFPPGHDVQFSTFTQTVQKENPSVKTLLSIGGGVSSPSIFASMASQPDTRKSFIDSSIKLARSFDFHGLSLNWLYPSTEEEMANMGKLLIEWRKAIVEESNWTGNEMLLLVAAVYFMPEHRTLKFPIEPIKENLDWINVLEYDFYSPVPSRDVTGPFAALYNHEHPDITRCADTGIQAWLNEGVPSGNIVFGLPFYGYAWLLEDATMDGMFAPADGPADGPSNGVFINPSDGTIFYNQIQYFIAKYRSTIHQTFDTDYVVDYCSAGKTWIGYNGKGSVTTKVDYAKVKGLLGYYAWHVGGDRNGELAQTAYATWTGM